VLAALFVYQALLLVVVAAHPTDRAVAEWFHRATLFGGAVIVGAAIAHRRQTAQALRAFYLACVVIVPVAVVDTLTSGLEPAYPFGMHKNAAGTLFAIGLVILVIAPGVLEVRPTTIRFLRVLLAIGLLATRSRGAAVAFVLVVALYAVRHARARQRAPVLLLIISVGLLVWAVSSLEEEAETNPEFSAIATRQDSYDVAFNDVFLIQPIAGGGLRWFQADDGTAAAPHNLVIAELSEAGVVGLAGLLVLIGATILALRARRDAVGEAAYYTFIFAVAASLIGIFWVAGTLTLPLLVVGLAVGARERRYARARRQTVTA
jgi:O-antigen ligase